MLWHFLWTEECHTYLPLESNTITSASNFFETFKILEWCIFFSTKFLEKGMIRWKQHCAKIVSIRSFSGLYFPASGLSPDLSVFTPNAAKYGPEKLRIRTLSTQWNWVFSYKVSIFYPPANHSSSNPIFKRNIVKE